MTKRVPIDQESLFEMNELFFSRTDKRGIIESGNSIFSRVSEIPLNEMIGAPHNLIRHPDMPKAVFKLLWDAIQADRPIGAYVKNMSRTGRYYWVFAVAFPTSTGYVSLRLKPSSAIFGHVKELYPKILAEEKAKGMDVSGELLLSTLKTLGFETYSAFMSAALTEEMDSRDRALDGQIEKMPVTEDTFLARAMLAGVLSRDEYFQIFKSLIQAREMGGKIRTAAEQILSSFKSLGFLSVNMAVSAERAGDVGSTLAQVALGFKTAALEVQNQVEAFNQAIAEVLSSIETGLFLIGSGRLQSETILYFLAETVRAQGSQSGGGSEGEFARNYEALLRLSQASAGTVSAEVRKLSTVLSAFMLQSERLLTSVTGLEVIRITGKVEVARLPMEHASGFITHIECMADFIKKLSAPLRELTKVGKKFLSDLGPCLEGLNSVQGHLSDMDRHDKDDRHEDKREGAEMVN